MDVVADRGRDLHRNRRVDGGRRHLACGRRWIALPRCGAERSARSDDALHGRGADAELTANLEVAVAWLASGRHTVLNRLAPATCR
jgi:hypothetical protein